MTAPYLLTLLFLCGILFGSAVNHGLAAMRYPLDHKQLLLGALCLSATFYGASTARLLGLQDLDAYLRLLPWQLNFQLLFTWCLLLFVLKYTGLWSELRSGVISALMLGFVSANLLQPHSLLFLQAPALQSQLTAWGETLTLPQPPSNGPLVAPLVLALLAGHLYALLALWRHYRRVREATTLLILCALALGTTLCLPDLLAMAGFGAAGLPWNPLAYTLMPMAMSVALGMERRQNALRQQAILNHIPARVYVKDLEGRYLLANAQCAQNRGGDALALLNQTDEDLAPDSPYVPTWRHNDQAVLESAQAQEFEEHDQVQGEERTLWSLKFPLLNAHQIPVALCGVSTDITERKKTEAELENYRKALEQQVKQHAAELEHNSRQLHQAMGQLVQSEKLAALGNLVAGVAHELNTPIGNAMTVVTSLQESMAGFRNDLASGTLRRSQLDSFVNRCSDACAMIERNTRRAAELVASFKQVAVDQTSMNRRRFDLDQLVAETLMSLSPLYRKKPVELSVNTPSSITFDSYPGALEQIITNLVNNAVMHAARPDQLLTISIQARPTLMGTEPAVLLEVKDDGRGMSAEVARQAFDPFFTTKLGQGGSGLGLYLVHNIVTGVLGGTLRLDSEPEQGARFTMTLPLRAPENNRAEAEQPGT